MAQPEKPRSKIRIYMDILRAVEDTGGRARSTRILQKANLSHERLMKHLGELIEKNLVVQNNDEDGNRYYTLTEQGVRFLNELRKAETFVSGFGLSF